mgnify:CR=1 FL=1
MNYLNDAKRDTLLRPAAVDHLPADAGSIGHVADAASVRSGKFIPAARLMEICTEISHDNYSHFVFGVLNDESFLAESAAFVSAQSLTTKSHQSLASTDAFISSDVDCWCHAI